MLPEPLHPAIVHLPLALALLLAPGILLAIVALRTQFLPLRAWTGVVLVAVTLGASSPVALHTGESDEERIEGVVSEAMIEGHEARADRFVFAALATATLSLGGLLGGARGEAARFATLAASVLVLVLAIQVGQSGGELVYRHGAAQAYTARAAPVGDLTPDVSAVPRHESEGD